MEDVLRVIYSATFWDWQRLTLQLVGLWLLVRAGGAIHALLRTAQADRGAREAEIIKLRATADALATQTAIALGLKAAASVKTEISDKLDVLAHKVDVSADSSAKALDAANTFNEKLAATNADITKVIGVKMKPLVTSSNLASAAAAVTTAATTVKDAITDQLDAINVKLNISAEQTKRVKKGRAKRSQDERK